MTTIKSVYSKLAEYMRTLEISDHAGGKNLVVHAGPTKLGITVSTADLADALGLVTREEATDMERATEALRAETIRLRNGLSEAKVAKGAWKAKWEIEHERAEMLDRTARELRAELDEAEATIARVKELRVEAAVTKQAPTFTEYTNQVSEFFEKLDAALDPKPAFVLPTEVPARIWADDKLGNEHTFTLFADGNGGSTWSHDCAEAEADDDEFYSGVRLMQEFTGHTLIGAES